MATVIGINLVPLFPLIPSIDWIYCLGFLGLALTFCASSRFLPGLIVSGLISGVFWACLAADHRMSQKLSTDLEGKDLNVSGWIVNLPTRTQRGWKFVLRISEGTLKGKTGDLLLSWYGEQKIQPGDYWQFRVKLVRPQGSVNPGMFDYQGWLFQQGISARGYVTSTRAKKLGHSIWIAPHHQLRHWLREKLLKYLKSSETGGLTTALVIGESAQIQPSQWKTLSATGTNHLLVISGLHVGIIAAGSFWVLQGLGAGLRPAMTLSLVVAICYGALAGFGLPVQRALIMAAMAMVCFILARRVDLFSLFLFSMFGVLLIEPFASLSSGFWLSFGAVFFLIYAFFSRYVLLPDETDSPLDCASMVHKLINGFERYGLKKAIKGLVSSQWVIMVGLFPLLLLNVSQFSVISLVVNLVALPGVGLLIVPLLLIAVLFLLIYEPLGAFLLRLSDFFMSILWSILEWFENFGLIYYATAFSPFDVVFAMLGSFVLLAPAGLGIRWLGPLLFLPLVFPDLDLPDEGGAKVTVLDVGQGLSVSVRTRSHRLQYDAGGKFGDRFDIGERIVLPMIRRDGRTKLDMMVVSHNDMDHAGGVGAVVNNHSVDSIWTSEPLQNMDTLDCREAGSWHWDGVRFEMLALVNQINRNNESCILLVEAANQRILIPGDIESMAEKQVMKLGLFKNRLNETGKFKVHVLVAPHHGSSTSSSPGFLNMFAPDWVIVSAGYMNRFGHPHPRVLQRYKNRNIRYLNTANAGAVEIYLGANEKLKIQTARNMRPRFWYH